jgi:RND family efflux transporter MFP subunit
MITAAIALVVVGGASLYVVNRTPRKIQDTSRVVRGTLLQTVAVTGKTEAVQRVDMAFEKGGTVQEVAADVGAEVSAGQLLVQLDDRELSSQLQEAKANAEAQRAKLEELRRGARTEDVLVQEANLKKAQQDLSSTFRTVPDTLNDAYAKVDDSVRKQVDELFANDEEPTPQLTFSVSNSQIEIDTEFRRSVARDTLDTWKKELAQLSRAAPHTELEDALQRAVVHLETIRVFLNTAMDAVVASIGLSQTTVSTYKANVNTARGNVNASLTAVTGVQQTIAANKVAIEQAQSQLQRTKAGATAEEIRAQEAQLAQAEAKVQTTKRQIEKLRMVAPFDGTVVKQEAKVGEVISPNAVVTSLMTESGFRIKANVPEVDIGNIISGNPVRITLDAFPAESFSGTVAYVDPAETVVDGVTNFEITVAFSAPDQRIRSGLTANLIIETARKENVLLLPQFGIFEKDGMRFVRKIEGEKPRVVPVTVGAQGENGLLEITSGLSEGDEVMSSAD